MTRRQRRTEIHSWVEVPAFAGEAEEADFWAEHRLGRELLATMEPPPPGRLPPARQRRADIRTPRAVAVFGAADSFRLATRRVFDFQRYGIVHAKNGAYSHRGHRRIRTPRIDGPASYPAALPGV